MPWQPLPRIAFAVATYPFAASGAADLPLEIGDELYVIEETSDGKWLRGYLVAPPSLLAGLTSVKGQALEARVFSGIFPRSCVEVREILGESDGADDGDNHLGDEAVGGELIAASDSAKSGLTNCVQNKKRKLGEAPAGTRNGRTPFRELVNGTPSTLSIPVKRDPNAPRPAAPVPMLKIGDENPTSSSEPLIDEISSCLREWHSKNLHELLLSRQYAKLERLSQLITSLTHSRQQLLYNVLTVHELHRLREKTVWELVTVNKLCGGQVIVRDPDTRGRVLTGDDSVVEVTKLQSVMTLLDEAPEPPAELSSLHHLLLDVKGFAGMSSEATSLVFHLVSKSGHDRPENLSECFSIDVPPGGAIGVLAQGALTKTLFSDLTPQDFGDAPSTPSELYLVVKVLAAQQIMPAKPTSRAGAGSHYNYPKESAKPVSSSGTKASRRSLMWASKSSRSASSRSSPMGKINSIVEQNEESPYAKRSESRDGVLPPSTAGSRSSATAEGAQTAQRTVGVGVLRLNSVMKQEEEVEQVVNIWCPSRRGASDRDVEEEMDPLVRELMDTTNSHYEKSRRGERLQIQLRAFNHPDADALIEATPTVLSEVRTTSRIGFSGAPSKPRSDIYLTLNSATLARQNLLSRFGGSATSMPSSVHGANLQIILEVRKSSGEKLENCIYTSSTAEGLTTFRSVATERGEAWDQTIRLSLSPTDVTTAHVVMFLSDLPQSPFAIAYIPLWDRQAFIRDGPHGLLLYKIDENTATPRAGPNGKGGYLSVPWASRGGDERSAEVTGPLAALVVSSYLCSTRFSQDRIILGLLKYRELPRSDIPTILKQLMFVPEIEVVKLLSDVLDGLFGILVEHSGNDEYEDLVFTALVRVLDIVHDRRFNLGPLVDQYAEQQFNSPYATPCLIRSFTRLLDSPTQPETSRKLRATFKVVRHILKFIAHARGQQKLKEAGIGITSSTQGFSRQLRTIFKSLDEMMRNSAPVLVGSQTLAVQHFHTWLPELSGLLTTEEILHIAIDFMDSCTDVKGKLVLYKLILIINYSKLDLFAHPSQKEALTANTVRWIGPHWGHAEQVNDQWRAQIRLCCSVVASQHEHLGPEIPDHMPNIIDSYLAILSTPQNPRGRLSLLFPTSYPFPSKSLDRDIEFDETLAELSAVLSAISSSPAGMQLELADDDLTILLENLLRVHMSILMGEAFPSEWLSVHIHHHKSTMRTLEYLAGILLESFVPDPEDAESFNTELWKLFFTTLLKLVGSSSLALETFPEQKRRAVWKIAGDVREQGAELLRKTWEAIGWETSSEDGAIFGLAKIGGYQVQYVPTLVGPILELCLSVHEGLRRMAVEVLQTMIVSEWNLSEDLSVLQTEMIDCLDRLFKSNPLTESTMQKLFVGELLERFESLSTTPDEALYEALRELVGTLDEFLDLLVAVYGGEGGSEATHIINRLRLMEFLRDLQKEDIFIRYVDQLASLQAGAGNHAEAGLALRLHADLYDWDPIRQTPALIEPELPTQTHFERRERIYFDMIKHFEEGESWSNALTAYKELQIQYENNTFDFPKLARTERAIATIYDTISKTEKLVPRYFKVVFKGLGFPAAVRDKEFIYEGSPTERASGFTDRMQEQYPSAQIVTHGDVEEVEGQFLVVSAIAPHRDLSHQVYQRTKVPHVIRDFLVSSHPQMFSVSTKRHTTGPVQEHYTEKLLYTTAEPFPTILRRSEIIERHEIRLSPHETALERIVRKTQEMAVVERRLADGDEEIRQLLVDAVSISVNPASESSVACYRQLLPQPRHQEEDVDDEEEEEDEVDEVELEPRDTAIKMALVDHAMMIKRCLALLTRNSDEMLAHKHEELRSYFESTFAPEIAVFAPPQVQRDAISTPSPTWRGSSPSTEQSPKRPNIASTMNGVTAEEASVIRPISVRQRGTRLSFLGGKKKSEDISNDPPQLNGISETASSRSRSASKGNSQRGMYPTPMEHSRQGSLGPQTSNPGIRQTTEKTSTNGEQHLDRDPDSVKRGRSVRKRFSMLKLGKKGNRSGGMMGSLDEE